MTEALTFDDVLLEPHFSDIDSRSECDPSTMAPDGMSIPIYSANMDTITEGKMSSKMRELGAGAIIHRYMTIERMVELHSFNPSAIFSAGTLTNDKARIDALLDLKVRTICIDIAHGYCKQMKDTLIYIRNTPGGSPLVIAGNVATRDGAEELHRWGGTIIKVGIGPGSVCTTRTKTGVGVPQLSAIANCARRGLQTREYRRGIDIPIIADGGIKTPGDVSKALAAGACAVMIGGMLAGTDCVPGWNQVIEDWTTRKKQLGPLASVGHPDGPSIAFRGMASKEARSSFTGTSSTNAEGISTTVNTQPEGSTEQVILDIKEGIQSSMSYVGARTLKEFQERATFIKVTPATVVENRPHKEG